MRQGDSELGKQRRERALLFDQNKKPLHFSLALASLSPPQRSADLTRDLIWDAHSDPVTEANAPMRNLSAVPTGLDNDSHTKVQFGSKRSTVKIRLLK